MHWGDVVVGGDGVKIKIKSFNGELPSYLTENGVYRVLQECELSPQYIYDDTGLGTRVYFSMDNCAHLNGGSWEVVE